VILVVLLMFVGIDIAKAENSALTPTTSIPTINPIKELVTWTFEQNVGMTFLWDIDKGTYCPGAKWSLFTSEHKWLFAGLSAKVSVENEPALGGFVSFNLGKLVEKLGHEMKYLSHLEIGYYNMYDWSVNEWRDGLLLNVLKIQF